MTAEAYLAWEREQQRKHEFDRGDVFAMAGGSPRHNALCAAVTGELFATLRAGECRVLTSDQRVSLRAREKYVYPDVTVICGRLELEEGTRDVVANPSLVVEVLSKSTERYDRGSKWQSYRQVASLEDYLLVSQQTAMIEHYQRQADGSWRFTVVGPGERVTSKRGATLAVDAVYDGVFELPGDEDDADVEAS